ncbi:MAG: hypothetical protein M3N38_04665 [Pseudomonadota bacterium]|nr:hypothetical protein [Pseudomonadota bacterium]
MKAASSFVMVLLLLGACKPGTAITCPPLIPYPADFQKRALIELDAIAAPHLERMLNDYGVTRDAIRACIRRRRHGTR